ncbi:MAG TPA: hypothetical protein VF339_06610 [Gammaproteobacteria bacterium]
MYAVTDPTKGFHGGVTAFLVETDRPAFASANASISEVVLVPRDAVLGKVGGGARIVVQSMDWERALLGATRRSRRYS